LAHKIDVEKYNEVGTKNERSIIIGLEEGIWKLREIRGGRGLEGKVPLMFRVRKRHRYC
jgi:hypothetical protein